MGRGMSTGPKMLTRPRSLGVDLMVRNVAWFLWLGGRRKSPSGVQGRALVGSSGRYALLLMVERYWRYYRILVLVNKNDG